VRAGRVVAASVALALWTFGAELGPSLHLALHATLAPHTHGASVPAQAEPLACHDEGVGAHCHRAPRRSTRGWDRPADRHDAARSESPRHGAGSLAHRAVAFLRPPPPLQPLAESPFVALAPVSEHVSLRAHDVPRAPSTRGPPA
jgi:hypothetical protein